MTGPTGAVIGDEPVTARRATIGSIHGVSVAQLERTSEVLDGESITEAQYAGRNGLHRLRILAAAAISKADSSTKIAMAMVSWVTGSMRVAARAAYTVGQAGGH